MSFLRWITLILLLLICGCSKEYLVWYGHSPNRLHRVEVIEKNKRQQLKLDATVSQPYLGVALETIVFSEDSQRLAYAAETEDGWIMVVDGRHSCPWIGIGEVLFGPQQQFTYVATDSEGWRVIHESVPVLRLRRLCEAHLLFHPMGTASPL